VKTLKSSKMMVRQCFGQCWIIFWTIFNNVNTKHTCIAYCVLILKVIMYFEPLVVVVLKESKFICMSYIIINPWPSWIETYKYFNEFINVCTSCHKWFIFVFTKQKMWGIWKLWSWLMFSLFWHKDIIFKACIIAWKLCKF
jgi:hypothetical protein